MAIGASGRIVIEADPELKHLLHAALQKDGMTLKDWFTEQARKYLYDDRQLALDFSEPPAIESAPRRSAAR
jgi:hypothetical protein